MQGYVSRNEAERSKEIHIFLELEHMFGAAPHTDGSHLEVLWRGAPALQLPHPLPLFLSDGKVTSNWIPRTTLESDRFLHPYKHEDFMF